MAAGLKQRQRLLLVVPEAEPEPRGEDERGADPGAGSPGTA